ncbi:MAG: hypothetical protein JRI54_13745 [Deltaproteobacteria bacterium]|nr:hypothetical protein [Deltaproteobacteria bacterium]
MRAGQINGNPTSSVASETLDCLHEMFVDKGMASLLTVTGCDIPPQRRREYGHGRVLRICPLCGSRYADTHGTAYFGLKLGREIVNLLASCLAEGMGIRAAARAFTLHPNTVLRVLKAVGTHCRKVNQNFLRQGLRVNECQLDELWTLIATKAIAWNEDRWVRNIHDDAWIWTALDADDKVILAWHVGGRTMKDAYALVEKIKAVLSEPAGLFVSDDLPLYREPLLHSFGRLVIPPRTGKPGRPCNPYWEPGPDLRYAQVIKKRKRDQVVEKRVEIVYGDEAEINDMLRTRGTKMNTSYVERRNLTLRHDNRRLTRYTLSFSKKQEMLELQLALSVAYTHFVRPHASLRTEGAGWHGQRTPMMAKGLTDHIWTMEELLSYRVYDA